MPVASSLLDGIHARSRALMPLPASGRHYRQPTHISDAVMPAAGRQSRQFHQSTQIVPCALPSSTRWRQPKFWRASRWQVPVVAMPAATSPVARHWPVQSLLRLQCVIPYADAGGLAVDIACLLVGLGGLRAVGCVRSRWSRRRTAAGGEHGGQEQADTEARMHGGTRTRRTGRQHTHGRCRRRVSVAQVSSPSPLSSAITAVLTRS